MAYDFIYKTLVAQLELLSWVNLPLSAPPASVHSLNQIWLNILHQLAGVVYH